MGERFTYQGTYPTTVDLDEWTERDERLRSFRAEIAAEFDPDFAGWYAGQLLGTALGDRLDLYLKTQSENLARLRELLTALGVLCDLVGAGLANDSDLATFEATLRLTGLAEFHFGLPRIEYDRPVTPRERLVFTLAACAERLGGDLRFARNATEIFRRTLTSDDFLAPPPDAKGSLANATRAAALTTMTTALLDDMRDGYLRRYEEDEAFVRMIIGERVVKRFDRARQSARRFYKRQPPA
ncbi:MAG TPA: hypothetical protein VH877_06580 [Polyangia bacterium]|jgi:hypothetical protein|nr:hypothetical protein [Polyangia bacterium]